MSIRRKLGVVLGGTSAALALAATPAVAGSVNGLVTSNPDGSVRYEVIFQGGDAGNDVEVADAGAHLVFRDTHPINTAGQCAPGTPADPTDPYKAHCPDTFQGAAAKLEVDAGAGDNVVAVGNYPAEIVASGNGTNRFFGGPAADVIRGADGHDQLSGNGGADALYGMGGDDTLQGGADGDAIQGGTGSDSISYANRAATVRVSPGVGGANDGESGEGDDLHADVEVVSGGSGNDEMTAPAGAIYEFRGNGGADQLYGNASRTILEGGAGEDYLEGAGGPDELRGGNDDDVLHGGAGGDALAGGAGIDLVSYSGSPVPIVADLDGSGADDGAAGEGDEILGDVERLTGGADDDRLTGDAGPNRLIGGGGDDVIEGKAGADDLRGGAGDDTLLSADGVADAVDCGADTDEFEPDALDSPIGCENDLRPPAPQPDPPTTTTTTTPTTTTTTPAPAPAPGDATPASPASPAAPAGTSPTPVVPAARPTLKLARLRVTRGGIAKVTLTCAGPAGACEGTLTLRRGGKRAGRRRFTVAAGKSAVLRVRLAKRRRGAAVQAVAVAADGTKVTRRVRVRK